MKSSIMLSAWQYAQLLALVSVVSEISMVLHVDILHKLLVVHAHLVVALRQPLQLDHDHVLLQALQPGHLLPSPASVLQLCHLLST